MKKAVFMPLVALALILPSNAFADTSEKVNVVKFDSQLNDLIVERASGERLLIQHNRVCRSMNSQFPIDLIWSGAKLKEVKVAANEQCDVYNWGTYTGDVTILSRSIPPNPLIAEHIAELEWKGMKYEVDYESGCRYLRDFVGKKAYVHAPNNKLDGGTLYLPQDLGQCTIKSAKFVESIQTESQTFPPISGIQQKAENNQVYLYWDPMPNDKKWVYMVSRSVRPIDPADYTYSQMPGVRFTANNEYTYRALANDKEYYFYISARDSGGNVAPWTEVKVTSVSTVYVPQNNPDPEPFEIVLREETKDYYLLSWPDKSDNTSRYIIQVYLDGRRTLFKIIAGKETEWKIYKDEDVMAADGLRFTIQSRSKSRFGVTYSDGHFWRNLTEK